MEGILNRRVLSVFAVLGLTFAFGAAAWAADRATPAKSIIPKTGVFEEARDDSQSHTILSTLKVVHANSGYGVEVDELIAENENACNFAGGFGWADEASLRKPIPVINGRFSHKSTTHISRGIRTPVTVKGHVTGTFKSATEVVGTWSAVLSGDEPDPVSGLTFHCASGPETFSAKWVRR